MTTPDVLQSVPPGMEDAPMNDEDFRTGVWRRLAEIMAGQARLDERLANRAIHADALHAEHSRSLAELRAEIEAVRQEGEKGRAAMRAELEELLQARRVGRTLRHWVWATVLGIGAVLGVWSAIGFSKPLELLEHLFPKQP